jgi:CHASE3 domain sensor protein
VHHLQLKSSIPSESAMRKLFALAILSLVLASGVAFLSVQQSTPARADCGSCS